MQTVEIFAGAGGAAMGLHRAGFRTLARVEWNKDACATLRAAAKAGFLDAATVIEGDVRAVDWSPYAGKVDLLWASPPCQAWSSAGNRLGAGDDRNGWPWSFDVIDAVKPRWFVAENVVGLLMHQGDCDGKGEPESCPACYFHRLILPKAEKRFPSVQWAVLNSSAFGVPQHRRRVYLVCGPRPIEWPKPTHGDPAELRQGGLFGPGLLPWATVREALGLGPSDACCGSGTRGSQPFLLDLANGTTTAMESPSPTIGCYVAAGGPTGLVVATDPTIQRKYAAKKAERQARYEKKRDERLLSPDLGTVPKSGNQYLHASDPGTRNGPATRPELLDSPSPSVLAREHKGTTVTPTTGTRRASDVQCASDVLFLGAGIRRLTVIECLKLMSWPADYPLQGTKTAQYTQVGNGCVPPVVELLGRAVLAAK